MCSLLLCWSVVVRAKKKLLRVRVDPHCYQELQFYRRLFEPPRHKTRQDILKILRRVCLYNNRIPMIEDDCSGYYDGGFIG